MKANEIVAMAKEVEELKAKEQQLQQQIQMQLNEANDFDEFFYDDLKMLKQSYDYCLTPKQASKIRDALKKKRVEKYPFLLHPTYYPELDTLDRNTEEKLRLDQIARNNWKKFMREESLKKFNLSKEDAEELVKLGIAEKSHCGFCENCNTTFILCTESELEKHKRIWELEEKGNLTQEELDEFDKLEQEGYGNIFNFCTFCDEETDICTREQFEKLPKAVMYRIIKSPDLQYESLQLYEKSGGLQLPFFFMKKTPY